MTIAIEGARSGADLLAHAVHRHRRLSIAGLQERLFTMAFKRMVYAQIWEDPVVDLEALAVKSTSRIVTIASGGCNVMNYLVAKPERIYAVDLNAAHVALLRLKLVAATHLPGHIAFAQFFANAKDHRNVTLFDDYLRAYLDAPTAKYWNGRDEFGRRRITRFSRGIYRYGLLGRFIGLAHVLARLHGSNPRNLLSARSRDEQRSIFDEELAPLFDRPLLKRLLDSPVSLFGLGIPPAQYDELCDGHGTASVVVRERLRRLSCDFDVSTNYFAWQAFNRGYAANGEGPVPPYLEATNFAAIRNGASRVYAVQENFITFLSRQQAQSLDRYILLDAQDWMSDVVLGRLWGEITRTARTGARVILRTAATETMLPGRVPPAMLDRWTYQADQSRALHARDRSEIYGGFHLYTLNESPQG